MTYSSSTTKTYGNVKVTDEYTELPAQALLARLSNRPALAAVNGLLSSFPAIKIFSGNAVPIMVHRQKQREEFLELQLSRI
ncbi:uncharacterized protein RJT21DRAFT_118796 [Scheffersomyces amazonensis]|uniref:uncharacterized protein n=1 Tax=Scheffersomyces amazonensis TaxID=1078765 RepID=UPI00315C816B